MRDVVEVPYGDDRPLRYKPQLPFVIGNLSPVLSFEPKARKRVHRLGVRVAANPRRVSAIAANKMNASIPIFRFRYCQCLSVAARSVAR
jgi:hypothetical protein